MKKIKKKRINISELYRKAFNAFKDTISTLGSILLEPPKVLKLTEADVKVKQIWENNKESAEAIKEFERQQTIPERGPEEKRSMGRKRTKNYTEKVQTQQQRPNSQEQENNVTHNQTRDDDYTI